MQLPRGKFREIKKNIPVSALLEELEKTEFSGLCSLSYETSSGTLVFKSGKCILADFMGQHGDASWNELQKIIELEVDAALSTLDEAQIQLSLEFNKVSRIAKTGAPGAKTSPRTPAHVHPEPQKKPAVSSHHTPLSQPVKTPPRPAVPQGTSSTERVPAYRPTTVVSHKPPAGVHPAQLTHPTAPDRKKTGNDEENRKEEQESNSFDQDFDTFDSMDLENVTDKIRSDCKTMIKDLHLEHLMER